MRIGNTKIYFNVLIIFMVIFAFPTGIIASNKIVIFGALLIFVLQPNFQKKANEVLISKNTLNYLIIILSFTLYSLFLTTIKGEYDLSLFYKQLSTAIYFPLILIVFYLLKNKNIPDLVIKAFIIQSVIIALAILSEQFYSLTDIFRKDISDLHIESYGRLRGNAISGYQFFGLGTMYGFVIIYFFINKNLNQIKNIAVLLFISIIGIISSRFTVFAVLIGLFFWYFFVATLRKKIRFTFIFSIISFLLLVGLIYLYNNHLSPNIVRIINYQILLPIENLVSGGTIKSSSTDHLIDMYRNSEFKNILFGEGRYINETGKGYYKNVDPGYLRMLYYYGLTGLVALILLQYLLFNLKRSKSKIMQFTKTSFFIYFLLLNIKGDVFFYSANILPLILGLLYYPTDAKQLNNNDTQSARDEKFSFNHNTNL